VKIISVVMLLSVFATPLMAAEANQDAALFEQRCGNGCHQLPDPGMLKAKQWQRVLITMEKRMAHAGMDALTADERERLLAYLTKHARK